MAYSDKVLDHYNNPRNVGSLKKDREDVGTGVVGAPECGDVMKLQIQVDDGRVVVVPATLSIRALRGSLPKPRHPVSVDDMNAAIRKRSGA